MYENFMKLIKERCSVRKFTDKAVDSKTLEQILQAAMYAPTACNRQPVKIIAVNDEDGIHKLRKCTECHFNANTALIICCDRQQNWIRGYDGKASGEIDASIVTSYLMLAAASLGVGTTWVMYFIPEAVKEEFSLPEYTEPVALLIMGYPAEDFAPSPQHFETKAIEEMVSYNKFGTEV